MAVLHVLHVYLQWPIDGFGADGDVGVFGQEGRGRPVLVDGPFFHGASQNEGLVGPGDGELFWS